MIVLSLSRLLFLCAGVCRWPGRARCPVLCTWPGWRHCPRTCRPSSWCAATTRVSSPSTLKYTHGVFKSHIHFCLWEQAHLHKPVLVQTYRCTTYTGSRSEIQPLIETMLVMWIKIKQVILVEMCKILEVMEERQGGGGCKVVHSAPLFLFSPRCLAFSLVALVSSKFLMKSSFMSKLISLRLQSSCAQCSRCSHDMEYLDVKVVKWIGAVVFVMQQ